MGTAGGLMGMGLLWLHVPRLGRCTVIGETSWGCERVAPLLGSFRQLPGVRAAGCLVGLGLSWPHVPCLGRGKKTLLKWARDAGKEEEAAALCQVGAYVVA